MDLPVTINMTSIFSCLMSSYLTLGIPSFPSIRHFVHAARSEAFLKVHVILGRIRFWLRGPRFVRSVHFLEKKASNFFYYNLYVNLSN